LISDHTRSLSSTSITNNWTPASSNFSSVGTSTTAAAIVPNSAYNSNIIATGIPASSHRHYQQHNNNTNNNNNNNDTRQIDDFVGTLGSINSPHLIANSRDIRTYSAPGSPHFPGNNSDDNTIMRFNSLRSTSSSPPPKKKHQ